MVFGKIYTTRLTHLGVRGGARKTWWVIHRRRRRRQGEASATGSRWRKRADDTIRYETALLGTRPPTKPHGWRWERYLEDGAGW